MKFTFEADMVKGQCYRCPFMVDSFFYDDHRCSLNKEEVALTVDADECPLKEVEE